MKEILRELHVGYIIVVQALSNTFCPEQFALETLLLRSFTYLASLTVPNGISIKLAPSHITNLCIFSQAFYGPMSSWLEFPQGCHPRDIEVVRQQITAKDTNIEA